MGTTHLRAGHLTSEPSGDGARAGDDVTRYLCAAAHLSRTWSERVPDYLLSQRHRSIGPSAGVDLVAVLEHCFWARRRRVLRDVALWACLIGPVAVLLVVASWLFALASWLSERTIAPLASLTGRPLGTVIALSVLAAYVVVGVYRLTTMRILADRVQRRNFDARWSVPGSSASRHQQFEKLADQQSSNVIVYRGPSPFVGTGVAIRGWTSAVDVRRPKADPIKPPGPVRFFGTAELYETVESAICGLGIPGLAVDDRLYVDGREIRDDARFLSSRSGPPITCADPEFVRSFVDNQAAYARRYQCAQVSSWRNEMILTGLLRFSQLGGSLFIEMSFSVLPPVWDPYREVNHVHRIADLREFARFVAETALALPRTWREAALAPFGRAWDAYGWWRYRFWQSRLVKTDPVYEYGAERSLREWAMSEHYERRFQEIDVEMLVKVIESRLLDTVIGFLDERNIDTSQLRSRQTVIQNWGIMFSGGSLNATNVAVGQGNTIWTGHPPVPTTGGGPTIPITLVSPDPPDLPGRSQSPPAPAGPSGTS
jgi:hypothetical protein